MLHILLLILKIIGIILATILGIVLLLICVVLFHAIGYEVTGHGTGTLDELEAKAKVRWLFGLLTVTVAFQKKKLSYVVKVAWKKLITSDEEEADQAPKEKKSKKKPKKDKIKKEKKKRTNKKGEENDEKKQDEKTVEKHQETSEDSYQKASKEHALESSEETVKETHVKDQQEIVQKPEERPEQESCEDQKVPFIEGDQADGCESDQYRDEGSEDGNIERTSIGEKIGSQIQKIEQKIQGVFDKIKCTFDNLYGKIEEVSSKKDHVMEFAFEETHIEALLMVKNEGIKLLKKLIPKKVKIDAELGFDDPSITGKILAVYSILYPTIGKKVTLVPDFENKVIKGDLLIKGKIRLIHFVVFAIKLLLCKAIRRTYKDVRSFQL